MRFHSNSDFVIHTIVQNIDIHCISRLFCLVALNFDPIIVCSNPITETLAKDSYKNSNRLLRKTQDCIASGRPRSKKMYNRK
ncbi:unnamed protein product [Ambrosiozyma monospora]|uniref:Unnamed protein product n=1 Tax=Ambrosiozyma monospora TaxID=43982 RepID=A0A9W6SX28_AMBMO|nr:unnamed protein product [Ambrosiozyma monospora]